MSTEKCPYCGSIKKCHDVGKDGKHYHCGNCGKIWERKYKISTTITKAFFEMKMADLKENGFFIEYKEYKPFWKKRIDNLLQKIDLRCYGIISRPHPEIVFLVGNKPYRFKIIHIWWNDKYIPDKYKSAIKTERFYGIKCVPLEVKTMKETVYCPNNECGYHIKDEKELDEQTDACGNIICPNCGGMMAMV